MQLELAMLTTGLNRIRGEWAAIRYEAAFGKLILALKTFTPGHQFDPEQPRDWHGRWTASGNSGREAASSGREAECEAQYARDTFICNALKLRSCWESAANRYAACLRGRAIPTLRF